MADYLFVVDWGFVVVEFGYFVDDVFELLVWFDGKWCFHGFS